MVVTIAIAAKPEGTLVVNLGNSHMINMVRPTNPIIKAISTPGSHSPSF